MSVKPPTDAERRRLQALLHVRDGQCHMSAPATTAALAKRGLATRRYKRHSWGGGGYVYTLTADGERAADDAQLRLDEIAAFDRAELERRRLAHGSIAVPRWAVHALCGDWQPHGDVYSAVRQDALDALRDALDAAAAAEGA